jgi:RecJ-like exonuclease
MNGELVPVDCICSYCGGDGYDFEGLNECDYCHGAGLSCDHTETDHQEMFDEERPLEEWQKAWFR